MEEQFRSPLLPEKEGSILEETTTPIVDNSEYLKTYSLLTAVGKLSQPSEVPFYLQRLESEKLKAEASINYTGSTDAIEQTVKGDEIRREVDFTSNIDSFDVGFKSGVLSESIKGILDSKNIIPRKAAETLSLMQDLEQEDEMPLSGLELMEKVMERKFALHLQSLKEAEERGITPVSDRGAWNWALLPRDFVGLIVPWYNTYPLGGNVPGMEESLFSDFFPGVQQNREAAYLMDPELLSDEEFDRILPEVVKRTFDQTEQPITFGALKVMGQYEPKYQNKLFQEMLIHQVDDTPSAGETNVMAFFDYAGVGWTVGKLGVKTLSALDLLKGTRLRKTAASVVAKAVEESKDVGLEAAAAKAASTVEDIEDSVLPKAMNPESSSLNGVSQATEVQRMLEEIQAIMREAGVKNLDDLNRLRPHELERAVAATIKDTEKRLKRKIRPSDIEPYNATPGTGIYTPALRITVGTAKGDGYKVLDTLQKYAKSVGLGTPKTVTKYSGTLGNSPPDIVRVPIQFDETFKGITDRLKGLGPESQKGMFWISNPGRLNSEVLDDINDYVKSTGLPVEVVVSKDGNIVASTADTLVEGSLKKQLGFGDEVGSFTITGKNRPKTVDDLYNGLRGENNTPFYLKGKEPGPLEPTKIDTGKVVFSGPIKLKHGTEFPHKNGPFSGTKSKEHQYVGSVFGDDVTYAAELSDNKWMKMNGLGSKGRVERSVEGVFEKAFILSPQSVSQIPKDVVTGKQIVEWAKSQGYDGLIVKGWDEILGETNSKYDPTKGYSWADFSKEEVKLLKEYFENSLKTDKTPFGPGITRDKLSGKEELTAFDLFRAKQSKYHIEPDAMQDQVVLFNAKNFSIGDPIKNRVSPAGVKIARDQESGSHYLIYEVGVKEKGFFDPIEVLMGTNLPFVGKYFEKAHFGLARLFAGGRLIETGDLYGRAVLGEARRNALVKILNEAYAPKFQALNKQDRSFLNTIARVEDREARWMSKEELQDRYFLEFGFGSDSRKFLEAHEAFRQVNDIDWYLRNAYVLSDLSTRGFRQIGIKSIPGFGSRVGKIETKISGATSKTPVYDTSDGTLVDLASIDRKAYEAEGYVLVRYMKTAKFGQDEAGNGGFIAKDFLVKLSDVEDSMLHPIQVGYRPGGHRIYRPDVKYWVKGAQWETQPSTGERFLIDPLTIKGGLTHLELEGYVKDLNDYIKLAEKHVAGESGHVSVSNLNNAFRGNPSLPTVSEIVDMVRKKRVSSSHPFEIVEDRKLPGGYGLDEDSMRFVEESFNPYYDHLHDNGRLYYGHRGEDVMTDYAGDELPVLDVSEMVDQALHNITRGVAFNSYKVAKMERWLETFSPLLDIKAGMTLDQQFNAPFRKGLTNAEEAMKNAAETQRSATRRLMNWIDPEARSKEKWFNSYLYGLEEKEAFIMRGGKNAGDKGAQKVFSAEEIAAHRKGIERARKFGQVLVDDTAPKFLKGWAFDLKLGFLNVAQVPLQIATSLEMMGIDFSKTLQALSSYPMVRMYNPASDHKALRAFFKNNPMVSVHTGFDDADEFIYMLDQLKQKSGFGIVDRTHAVLDQATDGNTFQASFGIRDKMRVIFYETEKANKYTAWQVGWKMVKEENPLLDYRSQEFIEKVSARAMTLSRGMDSSSSAAWQKGYASLMTQFWTYPVRSMEMYLGQELTYTQKLRFFISQALMYGVAAPPLVGSVVGPIMDKINQETGVPTYEDNPLGAAIQRGVFDTMLYYGSGADVLYGDRVQTGRFASDTLAEIFGMSRYGPTSPGEMAGGASFSIFFDTAKGFGRLVGTMSALFNEDVETEEAWGLIRQDANEMMKVMSSWNNTSKGYAAWQAGRLYTRRKPGGGYYLLADELNQREAVFIALGLNPADSMQMSAALADTRARKLAVNEYSNAIKQAYAQLLIAYIAEDEAGMADAERRMQNWLRIAPPELRQEILDTVGRYDNLKSMSDSAVEAWTNRQVQDELARRIDRRLKEESSE